MCDLQQIVILKTIVFLGLIQPPKISLQDEFCFHLYIVIWRYLLLIRDVQHIPLCDLKKCV